MQHKKILLQSVLVSSTICLGVVLGAQAVTLKSDVTTSTTKTSVPSTDTVNTNTTTTTTVTTQSTGTVDDANVQFNEFFGDSSTGWVELYNGGSTVVDVTNWLILSNKGDNEILTGTIAPNNYAVFAGITANSIATLQNDSGKVIDTQVYTAVGATQSWSQYTADVFACDTQPTELAANAKKTCAATNTNQNTNTTNNNSNTNANQNTNTAPSINTNTTTATTTTADTTGGVNATSSLYTIDRAWEGFRLWVTVNDEKEAELALGYAEERVAETKDIIAEDTANNTTDTQQDATTQGVTDTKESSVRLSEVVHKDYVELFNSSTDPVDLTGYTVEVKDSTGIRVYVLPTIIIAPEKYLAIFVKDSGLEVLAEGGRVRLLDATATEVDAALVPNDVLGNSWSFDETRSQWSCTATITKEALNVFTECVTLEADTTNTNTTTEVANTDTDVVEEAVEPTTEEVTEVEDAGVALSEEAAAAVTETMEDFEELVTHATEQELTETAQAETEATITELVEEIEAIQETVSGEVDEVLEDAKASVNETTEEVQEQPVTEELEENINSEENTNAEISDVENSNEAPEEVNVNEASNANESVSNTNVELDANTNSVSNNALTVEDIDAERLEEELNVALDEISRLREENGELQSKVEELENKLYDATGEETSEEVSNTSADNGSQSSLTGNDNYTIITRDSALPDFTDVVGHIYFRELRAQPGDFTSTPGEYAFHNLDKVMYKLKLPDGSTSAPIYPGEVYIMDLEGGEYTYSSVNHPGFGPYKITVE